MIVTATQKQIPVTPRKMRMMSIAVVNMRPQVAIEQLGHLNQSAAQPLQKVIKQALANASHNHKINPDTLHIKEIIIGQGWTLKRWQAGARGRGKPYTHRRSHVTVKLESVIPTQLVKKETPKLPAEKSKPKKVKTKEIKTKKTVKSKITKSKITSSNSELVTSN